MDCIGIIILSNGKIKPTSGFILPVLQSSIIGAPLDIIFKKSIDVIHFELV
jgi:hypothetical protein